MEQQVELESGPLDPMMMDQQGGVNQGTFDFEFFLSVIRMICNLGLCFLFQSKQLQH